MKPNTTWTEEVRDEFQQFADSIIWSNDDGSEKYIGVGNMADWWLEKFSTRLQEIEGELEKESWDESGKGDRILMLNTARRIIKGDNKE